MKLLRRRHKTTPIHARKSRYGGGSYNVKTGLGTSLDNTINTLFLPTLFNNQMMLETLGIQSFAARNFIDYPVDDMFLKDRVFEEEQMLEVEKEFDVTRKLSMAMKAARQFGTGCIIMITKEDTLDQPLVPDRIGNGDLLNLLVLNRFEMSVNQIDEDIGSKTFGRPAMYTLHPKRGRVLIQVHPSRVIRFDGIYATSDSGFHSFDQYWGVSSLVPIIEALLRDEATAAATAHLVQRASVFIMKVDGLREARAGANNPNDPGAFNIDQAGADFNRDLSNFRLAMVDMENEELDVVETRFSGLPELMDKYSERIASAARIPLTRWLGRSPGGLNSTGDSDMNNYVMMVEGLRDRVVVPELNRLDEVLAKSAGIIGYEPGDYTWPSLLELGDREQAEVSKLYAETISILVNDRVISPDEGRQKLMLDPIFGEILEGEAPQPEPVNGDGTEPERDIDNG